MENLQVSKLPFLTPENLKNIMHERIAATKNDYTAIPMLWQGLWEMEIPVGNISRTAKLYIPKDTPQGTTFVLLNVPEGEETISFLLKSGWIDNATQRNVCIFAAEPGPSGWLTAKEELAYFSACFQALLEGVYFRGGMSVYVAGYGKTGTLLHEKVLTSPLQVAAAAFINASAVDTEYLENTELKTSDSNGTDFGIPLKDIPVPVWVIEKHMTLQAEKTAAHWIRAIGAVQSTSDPVLGKVYQQNKKTVCTPDSNIVQVCVRESDISDYDTTLTSDICRFLTCFSRYTKASPFGNSLVRHVDYAATGVERRAFSDDSGIKRECLIYLPKTFQGRKKLPLVFALHGACESVRNYFEESLWYRKAEQEGFMVVMPEASLQPVPENLTKGLTKAYRSIWQNLESDTGYSELAYFDRILEQIISDYPVDVQRIYCTGHSMGCMMTNFYGSSSFGHRFAALAATSGILKRWDSSGTQAIPVWLTMGQYDLWSYDITTDTPLTEALDKWLIRNKLANKENVSQIRVSGIPGKFTEGRYNSVLWKNPHDIPLVRYDWIEKKDHMNVPEDNFRFWDQWFSKWILDSDKGRCFEGKSI